MAGEPFHPGDVLGERYRLVLLRGRGGFGEVWEAEELLPDGRPLRLVALKLLRAELAAGDWAEEARLIASLRDGALVTIFAAGILEPGPGRRPRPYLAMELLVGEDLASVAEVHQRTPWRRVLSWARSAAAALDVSHRAGVVHLDLKPANLFLTLDGALKVLDFGIARRGLARLSDLELASDGAGELSTAAFLAARSESEARGASSESAPTSSAALVLGTPGFMAPEVLEGLEATPAADAYALAACIVTLVTGALPQDVRERPARVARSAVSPGDRHAASSMGEWIVEVSDATMRGRLRCASSWHMPAGLRALAERWLRIDPAARGVTAGALAAELDGVWERPYGASLAPFAGLEPLGAEAEGNLYGRGELGLRLARELAREPYLLLEAAPKSGLASLVAASIVPERGKAFADGRDEWLCLPLGATSKDGVYDRGALVAALATSEAGRALAAPRRSDAIPPSPRAADACDRGRLTELGPLSDALAEARLGAVLLCDEAFGAAHLALVRALVAELAGGAPGLRLVVMLDTEGRGAWMPSDLGEQLRPWLRFVPQVSPSAASDLVRGPALAAGVTIDGAEGVVADVERALAEDAGLSATSLALAKWWRGLCSAARPELGPGRDGGRLTLATWREQRGVVGPFAEHAEDVLRGMEAMRGEAAELLLSRLVRADGAPIDAPEEILFAGVEDVAEARAVLALLERAQLVGKRRGNFRLSFPALAEKWKRLHERLLRDLDWRMFAEELEGAAERWRAGGRSATELWSSARLADVDRRHARIDAELGAGAREFLAASRRSRRRRRMLQLAAGVVVALGCALLLLVDKAQRAHDREQRAALFAVQRAAAAGAMVTRSRRTFDPSVRVAVLAGALEAGSSDPLVSLELLAAARGLPAARFLTLEPPASAEFPWGPRYLLGASRSHAMLVDFLPDEGAAWAPTPQRFRPHSEGLYDLVPVPFDEAFVTRGIDGRLKVWRLRENRQLALAAVSPMTCLLGLSRVLVASAAPVVACSTVEGLARWDLRHAARFDSASWQGRALDLSPDGEWVAAARQKQLYLWRPTTGHRGELALPEPPLAARFSPRDPLLAIADASSIALVSLAGLAPALLPAREGDDTGMRFSHLVREPQELRFSESGLELAVCDAEGRGERHDLRRGRHMTDERERPEEAWPCRATTGAWPRRLDGPLDGAAAAAKRARGARGAPAKNLGPRAFAGGWRLEDERAITRDLVLFDPKDSRLEDLLMVHDGEGAVADAGASVALVERGGDVLALEVGGNVVALDALTMKRLAVRPGHFLASCPDGRLLAWRVASEGEWQLFGARHDVSYARVAREPGVVVGADPECRHVFFQRLDGTLAAVALEEGRRDELREPVPIAPAGGAFVLDGYVFDVRASQGGSIGDVAVEPGLWLAFGSGAMVRADGKLGGLLPYGHAMPRATAMADGPRPGELLFADETGVVLRCQGGPDRRLLGAYADREWSDIAVFPGGRHIALAWADGVAVLDSERSEIVGELELPGRGRFARWDQEGSLLTWSRAFRGELAGEVIPIAPSLARKVGLTASNLRAVLDVTGRPVVRMD